MHASCHITPIDLLLQKLNDVLINRGLPGRFGIIKPSNSKFKCLVIESGMQLTANSNMTRYAMVEGQPEISCQSGVKRHMVSRREDCRVGKLHFR
jgi:hypothetical protein